MVSHAFEIADEIATPYVTLTTRCYARIATAFEALGVSMLDVVGDEPIWPGFTPEPEHPEMPEEYAMQKALQIIHWSKNGLRAVDREMYELILRMTKSVPGREDSYTAISMQALRNRTGAGESTTRKALHGLIECGLIDAVLKRDSTTGNTVWYARAGKMPVYNQTYAQSTARKKDAARKRICPHCGGDKFACRFICIQCGAIHDDAPHVQELVEAPSDAENCPNTTYSGKLSTPTTDGTVDSTGVPPTPSLSRSINKGVKCEPDLPTDRSWYIGPAHKKPAVLPASMPLAFGAEIPRPDLHALYGSQPLYGEPGFVPPRWYPHGDPRGFWKWPVN
jgi:hypothetical protein